MCRFSVVLCALFLGLVSALPARDGLMFDLESDDTAVVESMVRETRAAPEHIEDLLEPGILA